MGKFVKLLIFNLLIFNLSIVFAIGRTEVVGYTKLEQLCGVVYTYCRVDQQRHNIHVYWMWQDEVSANRNQRYNFYDYSTHSWAWTDTGKKVFPIRSGYGSMDYDPITGCGVASTQHTGSSGVYVELARDQALGAGLFQYSLMPVGFEWPIVAVTHNQAIHIAAISQLDGDSLWYVRNYPFGTWGTPIRMANWGNDPMFPSQVINASKNSNKVIISWEDNGTRPEIGYYRLSNDGGVNWQPQVQLPFPPAFSGETLPSFMIAGLYPMFDNNDNLHIVSQVGPQIGTNQPMWPAEIWHYSPVNNPVWSRIARRGADTIGGSAPFPVGYNAIAACRASIIQNPANNNLYVSWEAFDSLNYEPLTGLLRADIWISESRNNGLTWQTPLRITTPNTTSKRYPCVGGIVDDSLVLAYMIDSIAGFWIMSQGRETWNPIVVHRIPIPLNGVEDQPAFVSNHPILIAEPNPFIFHTAIRYSLPAQSKVSLEIFDASGRLVKTLFNELKRSGVYTTTWNGINYKDAEVKSGVYFFTLKTSNKSITNKIIKTK